MGWGAAVGHDGPAAQPCRVTICTGRTGGHRAQGAGEREHAAAHRLYMGHGKEVEEETARYGTATGVCVDGVIVARFCKGPDIQNQGGDL